MEERVKELEAEISRAETAIAECEAALQTFVSAEETARRTQELASHRAATAKPHGGVGRVGPVTGSVAQTRFVDTLATAGKDVGATTFCPD